jgi:cobalt-precorrin-5B (C1)-methyltransferase
MDAVLTETDDRSWTTGTCAAAAAKAAALAWLGREVPSRVELALPTGERVGVAVEWARMEDGWARASVRKPRSEDPDATRGVRIEVRMRPAQESSSFRAGPGVGVVTLPGLALPPGEAAVNPGPRKQILAAIAETGFGEAEIEVCAEDGESIAARTFNPRLGVLGGISILGNSGVVRPYSKDAVRRTLDLSLSFARANGSGAILLVPGHIGLKSAALFPGEHLPPSVECGNAWGDVADRMAGMDFSRCRIVGHPGKLGKLPFGHWDTNSSCSPPAEGLVRLLFEKILGRILPPSPTLDGLFHVLPENDMRRCGDELARRVASAFAGRAGVSRVDVHLPLLDGTLCGKGAFA